jgi:serine phosphatase RsbU (regulator of sigma subunit)
VAADLLLGIDPGTERVEAEVVLDREATVLLYTDGLVERRDRDLDEGQAQLRDLLVELGTLPLDAMCDELLRRLVGDADDDVALLAVRLHRQDRPRPADAGPERLPPGAPPKR